MSDYTPRADQVRADEAERLLSHAKRLIAASYDADAAGSRIRAGWRDRGNALMSEAYIHAALSTEISGK